MHVATASIFLFAGAVFALAVVLLIIGNLFGPRRRGPVKQMPYESGMDPIHDTRRRFDVRFHLLAIAFLVFDVELLFLYPWAVSFQPVRAAVQTSQAAAAESNPGQPAAQGVPAVSAPASGARPPMLFGGGMLFLALLALGFFYDWRKGVFQWR